MPAPVIDFDAEIRDRVAERGLSEQDDVVVG
jgi:hypothetical protein